MPSNSRSMSILNTDALAADGGAPDTTRIDSVLRLGRDVERLLEGVCGTEEDRSRSRATSPPIWPNWARISKSRGKWEYAVRVSCAWIIDEAEWQDVDDIFAETYGRSSAEAIGANGVRWLDEEAARLANLTVQEVPVYDQTGE